MINDLKELTCFSRPSDLVRSAEGKKAQEQVWEELSRKLDTIQPGILNNI